MSQRRYKKRGIAMKQLRMAIQLFNRGDFVCAVTLAGAAEEILGRSAAERAGTTALDGQVAFWTQVAAVFGKTPPDRKRVVGAHNRLRNELKHNDSGGNEWITADYEFEALDLIDRAVRNYWLAYQAPPEDRVVRRYVDLHWN
jgi:hypothetical protein